MWRRRSHASTSRRSEQPYKHLHRLEWFYNSRQRLYKQNRNFWNTWRFGRTSSFHAGGRKRDIGKKTKCWFFVGNLLQKKCFEVPHAVTKMAGRENDCFEIFRKVTGSVRKNGTRSSEELKCLQTSPEIILWCSHTSVCSKKPMTKKKKGSKTWYEKWRSLTTDYHWQRTTHSFFFLLLSPPHAVWLK